MAGVLYGTLSVTEIDKLEADSMFICRRATFIC